MHWILLLQWSEKIAVFCSFNSKLSVGTPPIPSYIALMSSFPSCPLIWSRLLFNDHVKWSLLSPSCRCWAQLHHSAKNSRVCLTFSLLLPFFVFVFVFLSLSNLLLLPLTFLLRPPPHTTSSCITYSLSSTFSFNLLHCERLLLSLSPSLSSFHSNFYFFFPFSFLSVSSVLSVE